MADEKIPRRMLYQKGVKVATPTSAPIQSRGRQKEEPAIAEGLDGVEEKLKLQKKQRKLDHLPSMEYEDLSDNPEKQSTTSSAQQRGAQNRRTQGATDVGEAADTIFDQLKDADMDALYPQTTQEKAAATAAQTQTGRAGRKRGRERGKNTTTDSDESLDIKTVMASSDASTDDTSEVANLNLDDDSDATADKDESDDAELDTLADIETDEKEKCPTCGKETDKVRYCPKCGAAFCTSCAAITTSVAGKQVKEYACPKCKTKVKV